MDDRRRADCELVKRLIVGITGTCVRPLHAVAATAALGAALLAAAPANAGPYLAYEARGSVEQVYATGLEPGQKVELIDESGETIETNKATAEGGVSSGELTRGRVTRVKPQGGDESDELTVLTDAAGAARRVGLRPGDRARRLPVPRDARRDEARDHRPPAVGHHQRHPRPAAVPTSRSTLPRRP